MHILGVHKMPGNNDLAPAGMSDGIPEGEPRATQKTRLRIAYDRDAQECRRHMESRQSPPGPERRPGTLDRGLQGKIGRMLRDVYSDVAEEPVPERFVLLLEALEAREKGR